MRPLCLVSKVGYWHTVRRGRPVYGKRPTSVQPPRIAARRMVADFVWQQPGSYMPYRAMIWKQLLSRSERRHAR